MVTRRLLESEQGKLLMDVYPRECRLVLVRGRRVDALGHETFPAFVEKFRQFLDGRLDLPRNRHDDGFEWQSLGFLWAPYRFLFGRSGENSRVLKFWDAQVGEPLGEMEISSAEAALWSDQLCELLDRDTDAAGAPGHAGDAEPAEIDLRMFADCLRERDLQAFRGVAQRHDCVIILCVPDPLARQYIGRDGFVPQPPNLHAVARQSAPNAGLLAADPRDAELTRPLAGAAQGATFEDFVHGLAAAGFTAGTESEGYLLRDALGNRYYPAYRLHGVYDATAGRNLWTPGGGALWREMNTRLGLDLIQSGPIDQSECVVASDNAGNPLDPQPPVLAFEPDGQVRALLDAREMRSYYDVHGLGWPYSKRLDGQEDDF